MKSKPYKYKLEEMFVRQHGKLAPAAKREFARLIGISYSCLQAECSIELDKGGVIPADRLALYAAHFGVQPSELRNHVSTSQNLHCHA